MNSIYNICSCGSGKKFKFCCHETLKDLTSETFAKAVMQWPVVLCCIGRNWQENGLGMVLISREMPSKNNIIGMYLVDIWCLGIKDVIVETNVNLDRISYLAETIATSAEGLETLTYEDARSIILGALKYAKGNGFSPHEDWKFAQHIIESSRPFEDKFEFGRNGKPMYVAGPNDKAIYKRHVKKVQAVDGDWIIPADDEW